MRIKVTEETLKLNIDGKLVAFHEGDQVTVDEDIGRLACAHGWAEDLDGNVETGERIPGASGEIVPDNVEQQAR